MGNLADGSTAGHVDVRKQVVIYHRWGTILKEICKDLSLS
jgi:hypothetical protein